MTIDDLHTAYFWHRDALRSRSVSTRVHWGQLTVPALPPRPLADCERELALKLALAPGDVIDTVGSVMSALAISPCR
jgi:hypothetical protein